MAGFIEAWQKSFSGEDEFDRSAKNIHRCFIEEMNNKADNSEYNPKLSSMDMKYNFCLQKERASAHGIDIKCRFITDEKSFTGVSVLMGNDKRYVTRIPVTTCSFDKEYVSGKRTIKKERYNGTITTYVVFADGQFTDSSYCCPNCGDINRVSRLIEQGCRSCGTRFMMPDLYPKITNFYTMNEKPYTRAKLLPFILLGIMSTLIFFFLYSSKQLEMGFDYIFSMIVTAACGIVFGFLFYAVGMIMLLIIDAVVSGPWLSAFNRTRKKLPHFMQKYDPLFSVDFFVGKVNNLLKTLIYSDNYKNCSVYEKDGDNPYKDMLCIARYR